MFRPRVRAGVRDCRHGPSDQQFLTMTEFGSVMLLSVILRPGMTVVRTPVFTLSAMTQPSRCPPVSTRDPFGAARLT